MLSLCVSWCPDLSSFIRTPSISEKKPTWMTSFSLNHPRKDMISKKGHSLRSKEKKTSIHILREPNLTFEGDRKPTLLICDQSVLSWAQTSDQQLRLAQYSHAPKPICWPVINILLSWTCVSVSPQGEWGSAGTKIEGRKTPILTPNFKGWVTSLLFCSELEERVYCATRQSSKVPH